MAPSVLKSWTVLHDLFPCVGIFQTGTNAVLYVGYKSKEMLLFLPQENKNYHLWKTSINMYKSTRFSFDKRVVAVIDPPGEEKNNFSMDACRVLKFVVNDAPIHFRNWWENGILLVTSIPSTKEVLAMTHVLWNDERTPHPWQYGKQITSEEKGEEIKKRVELVGPIPRLVFNSASFLDAIEDYRRNARRVAQVLSDVQLYEAMLGRYTSTVSTHPLSVSGTLFHRLPMHVYPRNWKQRTAITRQAALQLTSVSELVLRDRIKAGIAESRKVRKFLIRLNLQKESLSTEGPIYEERRTCWGIQKTRYTPNKRTNEEKAYRPKVGSFPFIDFATNITPWFNAKSTTSTKEKLSKSKKIVQVRFFVSSKKLWRILCQYKKSSRFSPATTGPHYTCQPRGWARREWSQKYEIFWPNGSVRSHQFERVFYKGLC